MSVEESSRSKLSVLYHFAERDIYVLHLIGGGFHVRFSPTVSKKEAYQGSDLLGRWSDHLKVSYSCISKKS